MAATLVPSGMESVSDPKSLLVREDVDADEVEFEVDEAEFEAVVENWDDHAVVGITTDEGDVLLMNDGSHGWTLTAFPVEPAEDWAVAGRRGVENLTGTTVDLVRPERIRRYDVHAGNDPDRRATMYDVVFHASPVANSTVASEMVTSIADDNRDAGWFDELPDGVDLDSDPVEDIRLFLD